MTCCVFVFQTIFSAELDNSFSGVALDDISVLEGRCLGSKNKQIDLTLMTEMTLYIVLLFKVKPALITYLTDDSDCVKFLLHINHLRIPEIQYY